MNLVRTKGGGSLNPHLDSGAPEMRGSVLVKELHQFQFQHLQQKKRELNKSEGKK